MLINKLSDRIQMKLAVELFSASNYNLDQTPNMDEDISLEIAEGTTLVHQGSLTWAINPELWLEIALTQGGVLVNKP